MFNEGKYRDILCVGTPECADSSDKSTLRPTWDDVWVRVASEVAQRSLCTRAQVGAVIVDVNNRIIATGYNNPPAGFQHNDLPCHSWCERARKCRNEDKFKEIALLERDYSDCPALHAEANALMAADRSTWQDGTMYVLGDVCFNCAKLIANSGLKQLVVKRDNVNRDYRIPTKSYDLLEYCGMLVSVEEQK